MKFRTILCACGILATPTLAPAQQAQRDPQIGYAYPAGGQRGSVVEVWVGGQAVRSASGALISGEGVKAEVIHTFRAVRNLQKEDRDEIRARLALRRAELTGAPPPTPTASPARPPDPTPGRADSATTTAAPDGKAPKKPAATAALAAREPLDLPELWNLERATLRELQHIEQALAFSRKKQPNQQIAETVLLRVTISDGARPGDRELRLLTREGLTNPLCFQVGVAPEVRELEPNDPAATAKPPDDPPLTLPITINGQVGPGDVDRFRFLARKGQNLVITTQARHLIPYLADAVPGWFQATIALHDANGRELAYDDDDRFNPDPVLCYRVPADGTYTVAIRDAIFRGREDFVYRVRIGEDPFIRAVYPLGAPLGAEARAWVAGWNLPQQHLPLDTRGGEGPGPVHHIRFLAYTSPAAVSNAVPYALDSLPEVMESAGAGDPGAPQPVTSPVIVNGIVRVPGEWDRYRVEGQPGTALIAEVTARRLNSPLDSLVRVTTARGETIAWNDDSPLQESGLQTHLADSLVSFEIPADGVCLVSVGDAQNAGSEYHAYRLRISAPRPDFAARIAPSSVNIPAGRTQALTVHVVRRDGFSGEIELALKDAPAGFRLGGARIPAGRDSVRVTLTAPEKSTPKPVALTLVARAAGSGGEAARVHEVVPADDRMQAFAYRHLVPAQQLLVQVTGNRGRTPPLQLVETGPVVIPAGGTREVRLRTAGLAQGAAKAKGRSATTSNSTAAAAPPQNLSLELDDPPKGISVARYRREAGELVLTLRAGDGATSATKGNLIVSVIGEGEAPGKGAKGAAAAAATKRRVSLGILPAIPFEVSEGGNPR